MAKKKKKKVQEEIIEETNEEIKEDTEQIEENTENNVDDELVVEEVKDDEMFDKKTIKKTNNKKHIFTDFIIIITMLSSLGYFFINITDKNSTFSSLINCSILVLFTAKSMYALPLIERLFTVSAIGVKYTILGIKGSSGATYVKTESIVLSKTEPQQPHDLDNIQNVAPSIQCS